LRQTDSALAARRSTTSLIMSGGMMWTVPISSPPG
jgi:hypothetical protein